VRKKQASYKALSILYQFQIATKLTLLYASANSTVEILHIDGKFLPYFSNFSCKL